MSATVVTKSAPIVQRLALIGTGLIGGSIARAARASGAAKTIVATARSAETRKRVVELGFADQVTETNAQAVEGRRSRHRLHSGRRQRRGRQGDRPASEARRDPVRRRLGQGLGRARHGALRAERRAFHSGASGRRHGEFRPRCRLCRTLRQSLVHPDAGRRHRSGGDRNTVRVLERARRQCRDHDAGSPRPGARGDEPSAASHRLHDRRHRRRTRRRDANPKC